MYSIQREYKKHTFLENQRTKTHLYSMLTARGQKLPNRLQQAFEWIHNKTDWNNTDNHRNTQLL